MAVVTAFRVAIILAGAGFRVLKWAEGPGIASGDRQYERFKSRFEDPSESDEDLSALLAAGGATLAEVATYAEPFELRKVHMMWTVDSNDVAGEDVRVCTFHLLKLAGGNPSAAWLEADFTEAFDGFNAWWTSLKAYYAANTVWTAFKVYKSGPAIAPPQVPVYSWEGAGGGGSGGGSALPPQVAITCTERAGTKAHWGRFYLPAPSALATVLGTTGRLHATFQNAVADITDTLYQTLKAADLLPVVYRPPLPVRQTAAEKRLGVLPGSLPARSGSAWSIDEISVDNVFDVIRSRRYDRPTSRSDRDIA